STSFSSFDRLPKRSKLRTQATATEKSRHLTEEPFMSTSRRDFLNLSGLAIGAAGLGALPSLAALKPAASTVQAQETQARPSKAQKPLRILILGGTGFIGPHQVRYAIARGHKLTLFNRGKTNPGLFPGVEKLQGDRASGEYASLKGGDFDAVIDNPTTLQCWAREGAEALRGTAKQEM